MTKSINELAAHCERKVLEQEWGSNAVDIYRTMGEILRHMNRIDRQVNGLPPVDFPPGPPPRLKTGEAQSGS
jgi:hypothetical protein